MDSLEKFLVRAETLLARLETVILPTPPSVDWHASPAFRWRKRGSQPETGYLQPIAHRSSIAFDDLHNIDRQKQILEQNTRQFIAGKPANNILLTGARGTGKSSLIKACLNRFSAEGLRLIEVDKSDLTDLMDIVDMIAERPERFVIFCDDLSFEEGETGYKALKVALDGSIATTSNNVLVYATSNRRHLMPERLFDNRSYTRSEQGDIHPGETVEEKTSLSERFGIWLSFYPFNQEEYLLAVSHWLSAFGCTPAEIQASQPEALRWAMRRGSRSGRIAWQFAMDHVGKHK